MSDIEDKIKAFAEKTGETIESIWIKFVDFLEGKHEEVVVPAEANQNSETAAPAAEVTPQNPS